MSTFAVGEVAILVLNPTSRFNGAEVMIKSPLKFARTTHGAMAVYEIDVPGLSALEQLFEIPCAPPSMLRKRRPPPDWHQLCNLDEAPRDCVSEREVVT